MKVLSLHQPWASLVVMNAKQYEVRRWQTKYRGPLLIHASSRKLTRREKVLWEEDDYFRAFIKNTDFLPYGCIIGQVHLLHIYPTGWLIRNLERDPLVNWQQELTFDDYTPGRYAWKLGHAQQLSRFLPVKGSLGLWEYNGSL
jgi:hypothetical protein